METPHASVVVILSAGGAQLDLAALHDVPRGRVVRAEFARGERAACVAVTLEHECSARELLGVLRPWASGRGWSVTVAPLVGPR
jgi:RecG-like helicase